jgi:chorismate mutase
MEIKSINKELSVQGGRILISGPCSAETEDQVIETCKQLALTKKVDVLRSGIWKPRTKPGYFEGVGSIGLNWLVTAGKETGLKTSTEIATAKHAEEALKAGIDMLWIGARTTVNPFAVQEIVDSLKGVDIPVLIKNPVNPDLALWEGAIERFYAAGIQKIGVIHRGFSLHTKSEYRNAPLWQLPIELKRKYPELTIICDPSHICGNTKNILAISQESLDLNFDGLMVESHINPTGAWSDASQQLLPNQVLELINNLEIRESQQGIEHAPLQQLRSKINGIDDDLLDLLKNRMSIVEEIGLYKKKHKMTILQSNRWEEILRDKLKKANDYELSTDFVVKVLSAIHIESIERQNKIMNKNKWLERILKKDKA